MSLTRGELAALRDTLSGGAPVPTQRLIEAIQTAIDLDDAVALRNRALRDGRQIPGAKITAAIEKTKQLFLQKAREYESGDLAEEWMKALRVLCEVERL